MLEALQFSFMQRAFVAGLAVGIVAPVIGLFMVLRRLSLIGDTLAHVTLAGVATGLILRVYPVATAIIFAVGAALGIEKLREQYRQYSELAAAVTLSLAIGLSAVILSWGKTPGVDLFTYLFGSIITVSATDVLIVTGLATAVVVLLCLLYKEIFLITFDEELARAGGLPVGVINILFTVLTAVTVAVTMRVVGVLLVSSLMVLPSATALQISGRFRTTVLLSVAFAETSVIIGLLAAYFLDVVPGGTIVLTAAGILLAVILAKRIAKGRRYAAGPGSTAVP